MADNIPTLRQFEALKYVYFMNLDRKEAGNRMGITRQAVDKLLNSLAEKHPVFKDMVSPEQATQKKKLSYFIAMDCDVEDTF